MRYYAAYAHRTDSMHTSQSRSVPNKDGVSKDENLDSFHASLFFVRRHCHYFTINMDCEVCELNNIGVCLLVEGRLQEARIVFSKAIGITKRSSFP